MTPETLSGALDHTADTVVITGPHGNIEYVNRAFEATTGFAAAEVLGSTPRILRSGIQTPAFYATLWHTIQSGRTFHATISNRRRDGTLYEHEQSIAPVRDADGAIAHFIAVGRDVTQRRRRDELRLQQRLEIEAARIASVLHDEAGQFLALAHMALATVSERAGNGDRHRVDEVRGYLEHVEERLRDAAHGLRPAIVPTPGLVDAIGFVARRSARRSGIPFTVESTLDLMCPAPVESLLCHFVQVTLDNVAEHAVAATRGVVVLGRRAGGRRSEDQQVCCSVRDDGCGFDPQTMEETAERQRNLCVLKARLEALGGSLTIQSAPGAGTQVCATLPIEAPRRL